ncbi:MAG: SIS domain-containing protein, partial [Candidatus Omnitrophica bacterium]|nr:SIS domain-containing protein [Candidatus Omnitrophota bacterium]
MALKRDPMLRRFFSILTILSFSFSQACPAWALRPGIEGRSQSGLEEVLAPGVTRPGIKGLSQWPSGSSVGVLPQYLPVANFQVTRQAVPSSVSTLVESERLDTGALVSRAEESAWLWIGGLTIPNEGIIRFDEPVRVHWPTVEAFVRQPNHPQVRHWMKASLADLADGIRDGGLAAVAAAVLKRCLFCATRGEAPSLQPNYDPKEPPLDLSRFAGVVETLENTGISSILDARKPVYLLVDEEESIRLEGPEGTPVGGRVVFRKVERGLADEVPVLLTSSAAQGVAQYLAKARRLRQERQRLLQGRPSRPRGKEGESEYKKSIGKWEMGFRELQKEERQLQDRRREAFGSLIGNLSKQATFRNDLLEVYAGGQQGVEAYLSRSWELKRFSQFAHVFRSAERRMYLKELTDRLEALIRREEKAMGDRSDEIHSLRDQEIVRSTLIKLKDTAWNVRNDVLGNVRKVEELGGLGDLSPLEKSSVPATTLRYLWALTMAFNGMDYRMETRGRDSLGVSVMATFHSYSAYESYLAALDLSVQRELLERTERPDLRDGSVVIRIVRDSDGRPDLQKPVTVTFVYKIAEVVGRLGENVGAIRGRMIGNEAFQEVLRQPLEAFDVILHSRWASAGIISIENAHPVDNRGLYQDLPSGEVTAEYGLIERDDRTVEIVAQLRGIAPRYGKMGSILAVLNGDIDNYNREILTQHSFYPNLVEEYQNWSGPWSRRSISSKIGTDTKLIPLRIEHYLGLGYSLLEAIQRAGRDFAGSFAIQVQSDLEPGKIYLAVNGKGQSLYVGISPDGFHPASEDYGFVDLTQQYIQIQPGQVVAIDQGLPPTLESLKVYQFNGTEVPLGPADLKSTTKTTRDVYLPPGYEHYFAKEIGEAANMFESTLFGKISTLPIPTADPALPPQEAVEINLNEEEFPLKVAEELRAGRYRRVIFIGMGTAHVAAEVIVNVLRDYLSKGKLAHPIEVKAALANEFQAFDLAPSMEDALVIVISQSGKTADTNQALAAATERGARPMGVINARESDAAFDIAKYGGGVLFTGTGRDIEIAVASTKAYYAQIAAGVIYAMKIAEELGVPNGVFLEDVKELQQMSEKMRGFEQSVTRSEGNHPLIRAAQFFPLVKPDWAVVGSGPAEIAAHEALIKLSELCYRCFFDTSISNLKHVVFSALPWALVLAANVHGEGDFVQRNLPGELDSMLAHTLALTVVTTQDDHRFDHKQTKLIDAQGREQFRQVDVIRVPDTNEHFAPVFLTMASHLLAYYIALEMNKRGRKLNEALAHVVERRRELERQQKTAAEIFQDRDFRRRVRGGFSPILQSTRSGIFNTAVRTDQMVEL